MTNEAIRSALFERLAKRRWISKTWTKDLAPNQMQYRVEFTELGIARIRDLYPLLDELGFLTGWLGGELEYLCMLVGDCIKEHGPGTAGDTGEPQGPRRGL